MFGRVRVWPDLCARRALRRESRCSRRRGFETGLLAGLRLASTAAPGKVLMPTAERYESPAAPRVTLSLCALTRGGIGVGMLNPTVFLSHTTADKDFARRLATVLTAHRIEVWFDEWEIKVGDSLMGKVQDGISRSSYLGVVLSPESFN